MVENKLLGNKSIVKNGACATNRVFNCIGRIHDIESNSYMGSANSISNILFKSHWSHLAIIFLWASGIAFHITWNGNFDLWVEDPIHVIPIGHSVWEPNFVNLESLGSDTNVLEASGVYNWLLGVGFNSSQPIYKLVVALELFSLTLLAISYISSLTGEGLINFMGLNSYRVSSTNGLTIQRASLATVYAIESIFKNRSIQAAYHLLVLLGCASVLWSGHIIHCSIPVSRGQIETITDFKLYSLWSLNYPTDGQTYTSDSLNHVLGSQLGAGSSSLTFISGLRPDSLSMFLSDIAHHHLSLGCLLIWASGVYCTLYKGYAHRIRNIAAQGYYGLTPSVSSLELSTHAQLSISLCGISLVLCVVTQVLYVCPSYPFISFNIMATVLTLINHCWIASLLTMGSFAHLALFLLRDFEFNAKESQSGCVITRILLQKSAIISGLSWVCLWLGFHVLGVFIHNDVVTSFGMANSQILLDPFFDRAKTLVDYDTKLGSVIGLLFVDKPFGAQTVGSTSGDYLVFHSVAFSIHVTLLILVKGALDGLGSRLLPDKANAPYGFPCDGPGRGGTCDISSWDAYYLSFFWMLNSNSWFMFGYHWKHILLTTSSKLEPLSSNLSKITTYEDSSSYLCGWFRDYLWFNSASLIRGYDCLGTTDLSVWAWTFLLAHLCWSTSFMFLISWRGYWQELIEVIIYMHIKTPMLYDIWSACLVTPVALSILQARLVGLVHFASGLILTYAAFVWGSTQ